MQLFYTNNVSDGVAAFSREESGHCIRVLRMRRGDALHFTDGAGNLYEGIITEDDPHNMKVSVTGITKDYGKRRYRLHIAISPLKNDDRLEWFIEKAVELGIDEITPLICSRTEKKRIRKERLEGLILSAMKQSVKAFLPVLNEPVHFTEFIEKQHTGRHLIACCDTKLGRKAITSGAGRGEDVLILIGPEGDFTPEEVILAINSGFTPVHIGPSRLRTETAGVAACCAIYLANI
ncbi:MAG: 16S rRNA (uracil(1498)-N(3))-methyltransferase [Bacteroidales bacterium]